MRELSNPGKVAVSSPKNLVVVRAGATSLHLAWLCGQSARSFDVVISYYDKASFEADRSEVQKFFFPGGKWDGLYRTLSAIDLSPYSYVWLPDDDIEATPEAIERLFACAEEFQLEVCQPALTHDSYYSHFIVLACPAFKLRFSNFVEIMVPCLKRDRLRQILPYFEDTMSGFGLDEVWARLGTNNEFTAAIVDEVSVRHTRPVGHSLSGRMRLEMRTPDAEHDAMQAAFGLSGRMRTIAYAAITKGGSFVNGQRLVGLLMAWSYLRRAFKIRDWFWARKRVLRLLRWQLGRAPELSQLAVGKGAQRMPGGG